MICMIFWGLLHWVSVDVSTWIINLTFSVFDFPSAVIKLKSGWQVEVSEQGNVRLWLQTETLSNSAELRLICNDREISSTPVG